MPTKKQPSPVEIYQHLFIYEYAKEDAAQIRTLFDVKERAEIERERRMIQIRNKKKELEEEISLRNSKGMKITLDEIQRKRDHIAELEKKVKEESDFKVQDAEMDIKTILRKRITSLLLVFDEVNKEVLAARKGE